MVCPCNRVLCSHEKDRKISMYRFMVMSRTCYYMKKKKKVQTSVYIIILGGKKENFLKNKKKPYKDSWK